MKTRELYLEKEHKLEKCGCPHPRESHGNYTRKCPGCKNQISHRTTVCGYCGEKLNCGTCGYHDWWTKHKV